jgi:hypothetical protein
VNIAYPFQYQIAQKEEVFVSFGLPGNWYAYHENTATEEERFERFEPEKDRTCEAVNSSKRFLAATPGSPTTFYHGPLDEEHHGAEDLLRTMESCSAKGYETKTAPLRFAKPEKWTWFGSRKPANWVGSHVE